MELLSVTMNDGVMQRSEIEGKDNSSEDKSNYKVVRKGDTLYKLPNLEHGCVCLEEGVLLDFFTPMREDFV